MARSEAQKAADKKYREAHKGDRTTWTTKFKPTELAEIDAVITNGYPFSKRLILAFYSDVTNRNVFYLIECLLAQ